MDRLLGIPCATGQKNRGRFTGHWPNNTDPLASGQRIEMLENPPMAKELGSFFVTNGPSGILRHWPKNARVGFWATGRMPLAHWPVGHRNARKLATCQKIGFRVF